MLAQKKRVSLDREPNEWIAESLHRVPVREAALTREVALATQRVSLAHRDPADRFLAATALVYEFTLVTGDERLLDRPNYATLSNL